MSHARRAFLPALVFAVAFLTFWPGLGGDFVNWDDYDNVVNNPGVHGLGRAQLEWMWTSAVLGHYIPLTWMSFGLNFALGGLKPRGYHVLNLLLHAANAVAVYWIARRLLRATSAADTSEVTASPGAVDLGAAFAALLFAVHPLRVESVVWITERKDVLSSFFFLLSVLAYLRAVAAETIQPVWRALSLLAFAAALLSKASAMPLPAVLLLLDAYPLGRIRRLGWRRCLLEKLPWAVIGAAGALLALTVVLKGTGVTGYESYGVGARIAMTAYAFMFYPARWLWPVQLIPLYELPPRLDPLAARFVVPMVAFVLITAALIALRKRWPAGLAAWTLSVVMLLPISGAVHSGHQLAHDRYSYLSGLGLALLLGGGLMRLLDADMRRRLGPVIVRSVAPGAAVLVAMLGAATWDQSKIWQDSETLWRWAVAIDPECAVCWNNFGTSLTAQKRHPEAESAYRRALRLRPTRATVANNIATALHGQRKDVEAEAMLRQALTLDPNLTGALANMGALYAQTGRLDESLPYFRRAWAQDPYFSNLGRDYAAALLRLAESEREAGRTIQAMALLQQTLLVSPADAEARSQLDAMTATRTKAAARADR
jgi:Tfp pilus assembly protein PilF